MNSKIAFIGGGNMATGLIHGLIASGYNSENIFVSEPHSEKRERLTNQFKVTCYDNDIQAIEQAEVIIIAVKPKDVATVALHIKNFLQSKQNLLLISIAAGITTQFLHKLFGEKCEIVRAMPNMAAILLTGATGLYADGRVSEESKNLAESIMRGVGITVWLNHEHDMDTVTALSGSGPAYFFYIMECLQNASESLGLPNSVAKILTLQTALGASRMAMESDISLEELTKRVAAKGGTTEAALAVLELNNLKDILKDALTAAKKRSEEVSKGFESL